MHTGKKVSPFVLGFYLVCFHWCADCRGLTLRRDGYLFHRIMNADDHLQNRQRSLVKRVICPPGRRNLAGSSSGSSGGWTAEQEKWAQLRAVIMDALDAFPDARAAVVQALIRLRDLDEWESG